MLFFNLHLVNEKYKNRVILCFRIPRILDLYQGKGNSPIYNRISFKIITLTVRYNLNIRLIQFMSQIKLKLVITHVTKCTLYFQNNVVCIPFRS